MVQVNEPNPKDIDEALELAAEIQDLVEELPERAEDFGISVAEQAADIARDIEKKGRVTRKQLEALRNMLAGVQNWLN
jgi:hypothetical protein